MSVICGMPYRKVYVPQGERKIAGGGDLNYPGIISRWAGRLVLVLVELREIIVGASGAHGASG